MPGGALCGYRQCGAAYPFTASGALDLRLKKRKKCTLDFELETTLLPEQGFDFKPLTAKPRPEVDFSGINVPYHLSKELLSYFPRAKSKTGLMLDLGCGSAIHRQVSEHAGFAYVGLDYNAPGAPILGDGHSLPFKDNSFEFLLSVAVLEHIRYPFVMIREAYRVLKPGGKLIGTVAFLEPFHGDSYYHYTHLGIYNMLHYGGFLIEHIAPSERWSVFTAQAHMAHLFPKMPRPLSKALVRFPHLLSRLWWKTGSLIHPGGKTNRDACTRDTTGAFAFIAGKAGC
jgi:SAM-dependent methyltransferase